MSNRKIKVGLLFGGKSAEHEVSLQSAKNVADAIDKSKYDVRLIGIDKSGRWLLPDQSQFPIDEKDPKLISLNRGGDEAVAMVPESGGSLTDIEGGRAAGFVDVVFPILHGPFGEDGTVQGLLKLAGVAFVGSGVLGSAIGMDKVVAKQLLRAAGLPVAQFVAARNDEMPDFQEVSRLLGLPLFIKPANLGSSVGVSKVADEQTFHAAIRHAYCFDTKVLIEEFVDGRELECAVLGNRSPKASCVGEIIPNQDFYSYDAKYIDQHGAELVIPADLPAVVSERMQKLSLSAFEALECEGLARVDFFLKPNGQIIINEINTIPGFTRISMYPQLWAASGISYADLIDRLIQLALERHEREKCLKSTYLGPANS